MYWYQQSCQLKWNITHPFPVLCNFLHASCSLNSWIGVFSSQHFNIWEWLLGYVSFHQMMDLTSEQPEGCVLLKRVQSNKLFIWTSSEFRSNEYLVLGEDRDLKIALCSEVTRTLFSIRASLNCLPATNVIHDLLSMIYCIWLCLRDYFLVWISGFFPFKLLSTFQTMVVCFPSSQCFSLILPTKFTACLCWSAASEPIHASLPLSIWMNHSLQDICCRSSKIPTKL